MSTTGIIRRALYPGTFDPVTNGHLSLIERACNLFDEVLVAVAVNTEKTPLFTPQERLELMRASVAELAEKDRIHVELFDGLLADLIKNKQAVAIVRGLRAVSDFEYEFQMALMNRKLAREAETVFLMPALSWVYLSSSIVKDVSSHRGDVTGLVPEPVAEALLRKFPSR
ncbi:MAG: pantetheine-phosphate adenylyltransferase [candidate division Zixibacteria bacterium]|nr:pantetheine-phosphate adenylyltransferase [candidate division Zixibacteria bacterium]